MKASEKFAETTFFEKSDSAGAAGEIFCLELSGYEGPLHTLLELARRAKVDLAEISMAQLAQQYLDFIAGAEALNMELAAEYLVMASWLVQLKSKYLLPRADDLLAKADEGDDARALRFRLLKLQAMRDAAQKLLSRPRFGLQLFGPGCVTNFEQEKKKGTVDVKNIAMSDLVNAYRPGTRKKTGSSAYRPKPPNVWEVEQARGWLEEKCARLEEWTTMSDLLNLDLAGRADKIPAKSLYASAFSAAVMLAARHKLILQQHAEFAPLYLKRGQDEQEA